MKSTVALFLLIFIYSCKNNIEKKLIGNGNKLWQIIQIDSIKASPPQNVYYLFTNKNTYKEIVKIDNEYISENSNEDVLQHLTWGIKDYNHIYIDAISFRIVQLTDSIGIFVKSIKPKDTLVIQSK